MGRRSRYRVNHGGHLLATVLTGGLWGFAWAADTAAKQRARARRDAANILPADWQKIRRAVYKRDGGVCRGCGGSVIWGSAYHCDHIYPRSLGGHPSDMGNLQTLCSACNLRKGARIIPGMMGVWLPGRDPLNNPNRTASASRPLTMLPAVPTHAPSSARQFSSADASRLRARLDMMSSRRASIDEFAEVLATSGLRGSAVLSDIAVTCDQMGCSRSSSISRTVIELDGTKSAVELTRTVLTELTCRGWQFTNGERLLCPDHSAMIG
ncbi:HNH endonuclease signature motif containing protein [Microbacterium sp. BH-3-3-3]|uniref:HNH endonuclease n=1 Tax=Microbacterium sp. BH-3-3-3 TaxID=1906742 RepID=UPI0011A00C6D